MPAVLEAHATLVDDGFHDIDDVRGVMRYLNLTDLVDATLALEALR